MAGERIRVGAVVFLLVVLVLAVANLPTFP